MVWVGGAVVLLALSALTVRGADPPAVARFVRTLRVLGPAVLAPATIAVVGFGVWVVLDDESWHFGQTWIGIALALFAVAFLTGAAFQSRAAISAEPGGRPRRRRRSAPPAHPLGVGLRADPGAARRDRLGHGLQARALNPVGEHRPANR